MSVYRRLARSKKGMSTIFGGLFFVILMLMGFNLFVWGFVQYDSYNHVITSMSQRDQQAAAENIVPVNPGATDFLATSFNITVNNLGGTSVSIASIYIQNAATTGQCSASLCIVNPAPSTPCSFTRGNIPAGIINYKINVQGASCMINDGSAYKVILATTRGRLFSFYYPWPQAPPNGGQGVFTTNIGPLTIYFDFKSFNYTCGTQTTSQSAFSMFATTVVFYIKLTNTATDQPVILQPATIMELQPYSANGFGQFVRTWIVDNSTINPANTKGYTMANPYILPPASTVSGPAPPTLVKFGGTSQGATGGASMRLVDNWLTFIGFYYSYRGQLQGETIPFMDLQTFASPAPPGC